MFDFFGLYAHSPSTLMTLLSRLKLFRGFRGEEEGESFLNGPETGAAVLDECM